MQFELISDKKKNLIILYAKILGIYFKKKSNINKYRRVDPSGAWERKGLMALSRFTAKKNALWTKNYVVLS